MNQPLPILTRAAPLAPASWNPQDRSFEVVFATEAPVQRRDARGPFFEVLSIAGMEACAQALPVLDSHARGSLSSQIGSASNVRVVGGEALASVRLSRANPTADRVAIDLDVGQTFGVSTGYIIQEAKESQRDGARYLTATRWTVVEISLVPVPADARTGIRSQFMPVETQAATPENNQPAAVERAAAVSPPPPAPTPEARVADRAAVNAEIRSIARVASLDQTWIDAQIDGNATVEAARTSAFDAMRTRSAPAGQLRTPASVGQDHTDPTAIRSAMADALAHRLAPGVVKLEGRGVEYRGLTVLDMVGELAVAAGARLNLRDRNAVLQRAVGVHSTSDFALLLADAANKALLPQYALATATYRKWAARKLFGDFRDHRFLRVGDYPGFKEINEGGELLYGSISESAEKVRAKEYGAGLAIGYRATANDDLSALSDFTTTTANRAAADENRLAYGVLATNAALSDGKALFHTDRGNLAEAGSTLAAGVAAAVAALRGQKSLDGLPLNLQPAFLVVGPAQEVAARQLIAAVTAAKAADVNVWTGFAELIVDAEITDSRWHLFASPAAAPVVVYGWVGAVEGPQVRTERDFDTRAIKIAASLDFAVGAIDFRGAFKNAGA